MNERVEINPRVCGGQPVISGTRISLANILAQLAEDESWDSLLQGYPELTRQDIQAALEYARQFHSAYGDQRAPRGVSGRAPLPRSNAPSGAGLASASGRP